MIAIKDPISKNLTFLSLSEIIEPIMNVSSANKKTMKKNIEEDILNNENPSEYHNIGSKDWKLKIYAKIRM